MPQTGPLWTWNGKEGALMRVYLVKEYLKAQSTDLALKYVALVNKGKDRNLSQKLFNLAEDYNTRPGETNYDR